MKIIEALKKIKDLTRKAEDLRQKVHKYHVDMTFETPVYGSESEQRSVIDGWLQAHTDIVKEIGALRMRVQKTNCLTEVEIDIKDRKVKKTIAEWISRRKDLSAMDLQMWSQLNDRGLKESAVVQTTNGDKQEVSIRRYYDARKRDEMRDMYSSEPLLIDGKLEIVNAVTELLE